MGTYWKRDYLNWIKAQEGEGKVSNVVLKEYEDGSFDVMLTDNGQRQLLAFPLNSSTGHLHVLGKDET